MNSNQLVLTSIIKNNLMTKVLTPCGISRWWNHGTIFSNEVDIDVADLPVPNAFTPEMEMQRTMCL